MIYIFLSGGLAQHDSFDLKPDAPDGIRGEFRPIATRDAGHLRSASTCRCWPQRSQHWALVRSLTHPSNDHSAGHMIMLTGRSELPPGFNASRPKPTDWPSIAAVAGAADRAAEQPAAGRGPARAAGPQHRAGSSPASSPARWGPHRDPWFIEASPFDPTAYGAYPEYEFDHQDRPRTPQSTGVSRSPT